MKTNFKSITINQLFALVSANAANDVRVFGCGLYGDHGQTMQAMPITGLSIVNIDATAYSDSGFKVSQEETDFDKVVLLNQDMSLDIDDALTLPDFASELAQYVANGHGELKVTFCSDYGDRVNTSQIHSLSVDKAGMEVIIESAYSDSGWAVLDMNSQSCGEEIDIFALA